MFLPTFIVILGLLPGLALLGYAGHTWWKSNQVEHWPVVDGEILGRDLVVDSDSDGTTYRAAVRYRYTVAGRAYDADRIAFGYGGSSDLDAHQAIHDALSLSDHVGVRYNPNDPSQSALAYGVSRSTAVMMVFGIVLTFLTVALFLFNESLDFSLAERLIVK